MRPSVAIFLVRNMLKTYTFNSKTGRTEWRHRGTDVIQWLIHKIPKRIENPIIAIVTKKQYTARVEWIDPHKCWSGQGHLDHNRLCRAMLNYAKWQAMPAKADKFPHVYAWGAKLYIWNGNHRVTAALILGKKRMRAVVYRPLRKKRK